MRINNRVTCLALLVALMGCASVPDTSKAYPPSALVQDRPMPDVDLSTNGGLAKAYIAVKEALTLSNNDKAAIRAWMGTE
jgi:hypothetical protein